MLEKFIREVLEWIEMLFRYTPGSIGIWLRRIWDRQRLGKEEYIDLDTGCYLVNPASIFMGRKVSIGKDSKFFADGGTIHCLANCAFNSNVHINASLGGKIVIGEDTLIGSGVTMRSSNHIFRNADQKIRLQGHSSADILIGNNCWLGANVVVLKGVTIGYGAVIGAGAVVIKDIPPMAIAVGVPAKVIKYQNQSDGAQNIDC